MAIKTDYLALGKRIRAHRKHACLTQEKLAELTELSVQFISNIERGFSIPSIATLMNICYALSVNPNDLLIDSLPEGGFPPPPEYLLRSTGSIFANTLSDWLLGDDEWEPEKPIDLSSLPRIDFMTLDDVFAVQ